MSFLYFYMPYVIVISVDGLKHLKCLYPYVNYVTYLLSALVGVHFLFLAAVKRWKTNTEDFFRPSYDTSR